VRRRLTCRLKPGPGRRAAMKRNRCTTLILMTSPWHRAIRLESRPSQGPQGSPTGAGGRYKSDPGGATRARRSRRLFSRRNWNLAIPLNTWVKRGDVIGIAESQAAPTDRGQRPAGARRRQGGRAKGDRWGSPGRTGTWRVAGAGRQPWRAGKREPRLPGRITQRGCHRARGGGDGGRLHTIESRGGFSIGDR